jgi:hypothetical protein
MLQIRRSSIGFYVKNRLPDVPWAGLTAGVGRLAVNAALRHLRKLCPARNILGIARRREWQVGPRNQKQISD